MFSDLSRTLTLSFFDGHCLREVFQTLCDNHLALDPAVYTRSDNLDLILRSQSCLVSHDVQIVFLRFLSTVV